MEFNCTIRFDHDIERLNSRPFKVCRLISRKLAEIWHTLQLKTDRSHI